MFGFVLGLGLGLGFGKGLGLGLAASRNRPMLRSALARFMPHVSVAGSVSPSTRRCVARTCRVRGQELGLGLGLNP